MGFEVYVGVHYPRENVFYSKESLEFPPPTLVKRPEWLCGFKKS